MSPLSPDQELRLHALQLAKSESTIPTETIVARADAFYRFLNGELAQSARERIDAALDEANVR